MRIEEIVLIENNSGGEIHLVKDRLFWQAWECSAFLFVRNFKQYKVHHRFVQKVMQDFVWLGFPESALNAVISVAKNKGFSVKNISENHIIISGIFNNNGFDSWKENVIRDNKISKGVIPSEEDKSLSQKSDYFLFRLMYDFSIYVLKLVPNFNKVYRFSIGSRIIDNISFCIEMINLNVNHEHFIDKNNIIKRLLDVRLWFRIANDLKQVSLKQWMFVNGKIADILSIISPESIRSRMDREGYEESSMSPSIA